MIYKLVLACPNIVQYAGRGLCHKWWFSDQRGDGKVAAGRQKALYEEQISELLKRPRTPVKGRVTADTKRLIKPIKEAIIELDPTWEMEALQQRVRTRQTVRRLKWAKADHDYTLRQDATDWAPNYRRVDVGLFFVNKRFRQEVTEIFYRENTIRIVPQLMVENRPRNIGGYASFRLCRRSKELLQTARKMTVRVQYLTMNMVVAELKNRTDLINVAIKFCDTLDQRDVLSELIEPFKIFREIDMSGSTALHTKEFSIEQVKVELDPHCDLSREIAKSVGRELRAYWKNIKDVVEGRDLEFDTENVFHGRGEPRLPQVGPWL